MFSAFPVYDILFVQVVLQVRQEIRQEVFQGVLDLGPRQIPIDY